MRLTAIAVATVGSAAALVGFAGAANASATIDLIWADTGTNEISSWAVSDNIQLNVILTAGPNGSVGGGVSVDYSGVLPILAVAGFAGTPSGPALPFAFGEPYDTGNRIEEIAAVAVPFDNLGIGLAAGQSHQLGTVTFHEAYLVNGFFEIQSDANGPTDGVGDLFLNDITATTTFNSAHLVTVTGDPPGCSSGDISPMIIEVNALRAGGKTVVTSPNETTKVTAKARILKGTALPDETIVTTLTIEAVTDDGLGGDVVIGTASKDNITLGVGKGGKGASLLVDTETCGPLGYITFTAEFSGEDDDGDYCGRVRELRKACR